jgi:hypothetical protein
MRYRLSKFFIFASILGIASCIKPVVYPPEPEIVFKSFVENGNDQATLIIEFTDGDGNIGLGQADTTGTFCPDTCKFHWNLFCEYYEKQNGVWTHVPRNWAEGEAYYYRIPEVTPTGQNPALIGDIKIDIDYYYLLTGFDTARFEIQLFDRDLNGSNIVQTKAFVKPN